MNWKEVLKEQPDIDYSQFRGEDVGGCCNNTYNSIKRELPRLYEDMDKRGFFWTTGSCKKLRDWLKNDNDTDGRPITDSGQRLRMQQKKKGWLQDWEDCDKIVYGKTLKEPTEEARQNLFRYVSDADEDIDPQERLS